MNRASDTTADRPCGLTALLPLGMSCRGRAEAFARRLQSRLRTLGNHGNDEIHQNDSENTENTWLTPAEVATAGTVTSHQPLAALSHEVADSYFDFDLPGSPAEDSEYSKLLETTSTTTPTSHDVASESGYVCASPMTSPEDSEIAVNLSRSSSEEPYFDVDGSDIDQRSLSQSIDYFDCEDSSRRDNSSLSSRSIPKSERLRISHNIFHSLDSDSCSESLPKSQSTTGSTCTALSSASLHTIQDDIDQTDFCSLRDNNQPKTSDELNHSGAEIVDNDESKAEKNECGEENEVDQTQAELDLETTIQEFKPIYRKHSREERKDETEISNDAKLINEIAAHESTPETIQEEDEEEEEEQPVATRNGHVSPNEDDEELSRPQRIRRCSSLKSGKTPPGTPGRKKIVRFADMLGLDLADVRTFMDEIPRVPRCAFEDLEVSVQEVAQMSVGPRPDKLLMPLFQQPGGMPNFLDVVQLQNVALENAAVTDPISLTITGSVRVRNLDFHKSVHLRYSTDNWHSFADMQATYVDNSCDGFSDKFTFIIFGNSLQVGEKLEIAVRFSCKGQQFWDNNYGANYCFQCLPATSPAQRIDQNGVLNPLSLSPDDTWCGSSFY